MTVQNVNLNCRHDTDLEETELPIELNISRHWNNYCFYFTFSGKTRNNNYFQIMTVFLCQLIIIFIKVVCYFTLVLVTLTAEYPSHLQLGFYGTSIRLIIITIGVFLAHQKV